MDSASVSTRLEHLQNNIGEIAFHKQLIFTFLGSFFLHLIVVMVLINQPIALDDMFQYDMLARSLKEGNGFRWYSKSDVEILRPYYSQFLDIDHLAFPEKGLPTAFRAPGYPFFLALLYNFVPNSFRFVVARIAQAALAAVLAPATAFLGHQIGLPRTAYLLSAIGISLYPILLFYPIGLASENLYILLGTLSVVSIYLSTQKQSPGWVILAGLLCGTTMLSRSIFAMSTI